MILYGDNQNSMPANHSRANSLFENIQLIHLEAQRSAGQVQGRQGPIVGAPVE